MELVARTLRRLSDDPGRDLAELLRRTLFIFLSGNADMHLKSFSFLQDGHTRRLAPAYDLLSTRLVISERDDPEELALPLNGKKNRLKREDFALFARNIGLNDRQFQAACDALAARLPVLFRNNPVRRRTPESGFSEEFVRASSQSCAENRRE